MDIRRYQSTMLYEQPMNGSQKSSVQRFPSLLTKSKMNFESSIPRNFKVRTATLRVTVINSAFIKIVAGKNKIAEKEIYQLTDSEIHPNSGRQKSNVQAL